MLAQVGKPASPVAMFGVLEIFDLIDLDRSCEALWRDFVEWRAVDMTRDQCMGGFGDKNRSCGRDQLKALNSSHTKGKNGFFWTSVPVRTAMEALRGWDWKN